MSEDRGQPREIPIGDANGSKPVVLTVIKFIGFLIAVLVPTVILTVFLSSSRYESILDLRFARLEQTLTREYALKSDTLTKLEYELRHAELIQTDKAMQDRLGSAERRLDQLNDRLVILEKKR